MAPLLSTKRQAKKVSEANAWAAVLCCHWARRSLGPPCKQAESCCRPSDVACCPPPLPPLGCGWAGAAGAWCYPASCLLSCTAQRAHQRSWRVQPAGRSVWHWHWWRAVRAVCVVQSTAQSLMVGTAPKGEITFAGCNLNYSCCSEAAVSLLTNGAAEALLDHRRGK